MERFLRNPREPVDVPWSAPDSASPWPTPRPHVTSLAWRTPRSHEAERSPHSAHRRASARAPSGAVSRRRPGAPPVRSRGAVSRRRPGAHMFGRGPPGEARISRRWSLSRRTRHTRRTRRFQVTRRPAPRGSPRAGSPWMNPSPRALQSASVEPDTLRILLEDDDLVVVHKPSGMSSHRGWTREGPVALQSTRDLVGQHLFLAHRLDRSTSGVLVFTKSRDMFPFHSLH